MASHTSFNNAMTRPTSASNAAEQPPAYDTSATSPSLYPGVTSGASFTSGPRPTSNPNAHTSSSPITTSHPGSAPFERVYSDTLSQFTSANRDVITPNLENKLRQARYVPTDNPSDMSAEEWSSRYGVGTFELRRLQELYDR
jgi:hypothetical protein